MAIEEQVAAYGGPQFQLVQQVMQRFAEAIEQSKVDVVPKISMGGSDGGNLMEGLMSVLLSEKLTGMLSAAESGAKTDNGGLRDQIKTGIINRLQSPAANDSSPSS
ncbi:MAG: hypothetical protein VKJ06_04370 [Vampirovibrionales bacterium]|nr:hypothetical protein [Vampirovibrionales bacterium]